MLNRMQTISPHIQTNNELCQTSCKVDANQNVLQAIYCTIKCFMLVFRQSFLMLWQKPRLSNFEEAAVAHPSIILAKTLRAWLSSWSSSSLAGAEDLPLARHVVSCVNIIRPDYFFFKIWPEYFKKDVISY
jgi:hypothetical protein